MISSFVIPLLSSDTKSKSAVDSQKLISAFNLYGNIFLIAAEITNILITALPVDNT